MGQVLVLLVIGSQRTEMLHHFPRNMGGYGGAPGRYVTHRVKQLTRRAGFEQIAISPRLEGHKNALAVLVNRDHDNLERWAEPLELGHTLNAGHAGQFDIHEDNIGVLRWDALHCFLAGSKSSDAFEIRSRTQNLHQLIAQLWISFHYGH